jgi:hypothetical protein
MPFYKKDSTILRFKPSKLKPEVEVSRNDKLFNVLEPNVAEDFDLPWNCFEWEDKKRKYGKRAMFRTARFKNRYVVWSPPNLNRFVYSPGIINFQL